MAGSVSELPDGRWTVRWRTPDGRQPRRTFQTKRVAERFLRQTLVDQERGLVGMIESRDTIADAAGVWWASIIHAKKPRTIERYDLARRQIIERIGDTKLKAVDIDFLQRFVNDLAAEGKAPRTVNATYGVLSLILKSAAKRKKVTLTSKPDMPRISRPILTIPDRGEVERLAEAIRAPLAAAVLIAGYCGLREGEILALHRGDVNLEEGWLFVHRAVNKTTGAIESTKTDNVRRVYMPARAAQAVAEHLAEHPADRLFTITGRLLQKRWEEARKLAGLPNVRFHDLRHSAASQCIHAGWSVTQVSKQLGHADPAMTLRTYSHLWPDSQKDAIAKLDAYIAHDATT